MKTKIVFSNYDDPGNPYYGGGGALAIHQVAIRLSETYDTAVITGYYRGAQRREIIDGVRYYRIGSGLPGPRLAQLLFPMHVIRIARRLPHDVWIESFTPPFSASALPRRSDRPVIGLAHGIHGLDMRRKYHLPFNRIESRRLRLYSHIVTVSEYVTNFIKLFASNSEIFTIQNGLDDQMLENPHLRNHTRRNIIYAGRIEINQKGIDLMLAAFARLKDSISDNLIICGDGRRSDRNKLYALVHAHQLNDRVEITGKLARDTVRQFLRKSRICLIPSRHETFSMVALECMALGTPIITFDIPGLSWIPLNCRTIAASVDKDALADVLYSSLHSPTHIENAQHHGQKFARQFTWERAAKEYDGVIQHVLSHAATT